MQGFNRYIPPDYDPKKHSTLNSAAGKKHALGNRAKDIDKGVLVVRFELPFNIWCGTCGNHIGAGVRYNAQKRKVGNYYSTPIFAFRCKCHLCSGWFEIRTDPKNSKYEVTEGAKQKDEEWNPEENGGYAVRDSEAPDASQPPEDAIAALEKTIDQQTWAKKNTSRITELSEASDRLSGDPYAVSLALRRKFREEKKDLLEKQTRDMGLKEKFGLHDDVDLGEEEVPLGKEMWEAGRERRGLTTNFGGGMDGESSSRSAVGVGFGDSVRANRGTPGSVRKGKGKLEDGSPAPGLAQMLRKTTARKYDPFADAADALFGNGSPGSIKLKTKVKDPGKDTPAAKDVKEQITPPAPPVNTLVGGLLAGYGSD